MKKATAFVAAILGAACLSVASAQPTSTTLVPNPLAKTQELPKPPH